MKNHIHGSGNISVMGIDIYVRKGVVKMESIGVYGQTMINKHWYCPKFIPRDIINARFY